jgi:hypothetical protein
MLDSVVLGGAVGSAVREESDLLSFVSGGMSGKTLKDELLDVARSIEHYRHSLTTVRCGFSWLLSLLIFERAQLNAWCRGY